MSEIKIVSVSEETNAWTRKGIATYKGKDFYYKFAYAEGEGYEVIAIDPEGKWTREEMEEFQEWQESQPDLPGLLDDLTFEIV
jgi:hypothetical protein